MCNQCIEKMKYDLFTEGKCPNLRIEEIVASIGKCPAMLALENLTPNGSEYWEDPKRCYETARYLRDNDHKMVLAAVIARKKAEEERDTAILRISRRYCDK